MKVIFDNIIFYLQKSGGGTIYWLELIKRANIDGGLNVYYSEPTSRLTNKFRLDLAIKVYFYEKLPLFFLRISNFSIPIKDKAIFHSSYYRISKSKQAINVVTFHDFTSELFFKGVRRYVHQKRKRKAILNGNGFICISNNTKLDLLKFYPFVDEKKIRVIYNGVSNDYFVLPKLSIKQNFGYNEILTKKFVLYVGHRTSYKNFNIAVETISKLEKDFYFLVVGEKLNNNEISELNKHLYNRYICLTGIDNETLNIFYNFAYCLIYPSSYEGFGIPILEAMKAGCPVVTTNKSSIPEVAGDAAIIVSEINAEAFKNSVLMLDDINYRDNLVQLGLQQASCFSWDKCYQEVRDFYSELYFSSE